MIITNHGPLIEASDYWESEYAARGVVYLSVNAGAFRLLLPDVLKPLLLDDMRSAREVVVSRGPWPEQGRDDALELLFDDGSTAPFSLHMGLEQVDRLPLDSDAGKQWIASVWTAPRRGRPQKALERKAYYRRVDRLPCLRPYP